MNATKKCGFCQRPATLMCARCLTSYCSATCQITDWADHKLTCCDIPVPFRELFRTGNYLEVLAERASLMINRASTRAVQQPEEDCTVEEMSGEGAPNATVDSNLEETTATVTTL